MQYKKEYTCIYYVHHGISMSMLAFTGVCNIQTWNIQIHACSCMYKQENHVFKKIVYCQELNRGSNAYLPAASGTGTSN